MADDDLAFRALIRDWLNSLGDFTLVAEVADGRSAVVAALDFNPDIVLMDVSMPILNGIEATRQIMASRPDTVVVGASVHADKGFQQAMLAAGARAYILKEDVVSGLLPTLRSLVRLGEPDGHSPPDSR